MADCLLDLVLRPGGSDLVRVQLLLTVVASVGTLAGGDETGEVDGRVVPAEMIRELIRLFGPQPPPDPANGRRPAARAGEAQPATPAAAADDEAPAAAADDEAPAAATTETRSRPLTSRRPRAAEPEIRSAGREADGGGCWTDELEARRRRPAAARRRLDPRSRSGGPTRRVEQRAAPTTAPPTTRSRTRRADPTRARSRPPHPRPPRGATPGQPDRSRLGPLPTPATATAGPTAPPTRRRGGAGGRRRIGRSTRPAGRCWSWTGRPGTPGGWCAPRWPPTPPTRTPRRPPAAGSPHAADALQCCGRAPTTQRAQLSALLSATGGGGLADRPRIALTDAVTGALLALTDLPELRRTGHCGARACRRHPAGCPHDLTGRPGLGPPGPTDGYRPAARLDRFLRARDRRCRQPGCRRPVPRGGELDHNRPYPLGPTSATNLTGYCTGHHRGKHQAPGWRHTLHPDGTLTVTTPTGLTAATTPPPF